MHYFCLIDALRIRCYHSSAINAKSFTRTFLFFCDLHSICFYASLCPWRYQMERVWWKNIKWNSRKMININQNTWCLDEEVCFFRLNWYNKSLFSWWKVKKNDKQTQHDTRARLTHLLWHDSFVCGIDKPKFTGSTCC